MGGTGLLIYGTLSADRLEPQPVPRTLFDRLLGRTREAGPKVLPMSRRELVQLDVSELAPLIARYRAYLARKLPQPHDATREVLNYLEMDGIPSLYCRGEREAGNDTRWYVQLGFSGCAGMAEVSATVAGHWAAAWIREELPLVRREILEPFGFTPDDDQAFDWPDRFLPVAALGYLRYLPAEERDEEGEVFEVDYAALEHATESAVALRAAGTRYGGPMGDGSCLCQLCDPTFAPLS